MKIELAANERAFLIEKGQPVAYLTPGEHRVGRLWAKQRIEKHDTNGLLAQLDERRLALVPADDVAVVELAVNERAVVTRRGQPVRWLSEGVHQVWTVERQLDRATGALAGLVRIKRFDTAGVVTEPLAPNVAALAQATGDYVEAIAPAGQVAVRFVDGKLELVLGAGRHAAWKTLHAVSFSIIDLRERVLAVNGQEVMTKDRVTLRLNLSATIGVVDARRLAEVARAPDDIVYLAMQLAAREAVTTRTLDEVLVGRDELATAITGPVRARAQTLGLALIELGVKDLILPGDMKDLLNKVIQAQKEAEANVIARREETAATRSLAQTAKVLAENPLLIRLKELEAYKELAAKVGHLNVVMGEGAIDKVRLTL